MKTAIQTFLQTTNIEFYMGRVPENSQHLIFIVPIKKSIIKLVLIANQIDLSASLIYWNSTHNFSIIGKYFPHYKTAIDSIKGYIENINNNKSLPHNTPDIIYLKTVLSHDSVKSMEFAQSMLSQVIKNGRLSDKQLSYVVGPTPNNRPAIQSNVINSTNIYILYAEELAKIKQSVQKNQRVFNLRPTKGDDVVLIPTKSYPYHQYPFSLFNPVQSLTFPYIENDNNLVIGANTSAGKTICAEMLMDRVLLNGKKVIYLSPLKSLTQEKYNDWQKRFTDKNIEIMTGDYSLTEKQVNLLQKVDIICMTSEMLDSRSRKFESEKNTWLYDIGLLIVDESHIVGSEGRGHACESGIMRFTKINQSSRVLLLSATMPNVEEFGEWLTVLNGKETNIIYCDWRPVVLKMHYVEYNTQGDYNDKRSFKMAESIDLVLAKPDEKFLVFVHDKTTGHMLIRELKHKGVTALFHNADLNITDRLQIEEQFRIINGGLRVMVSTSTTAWGLNLPARNVVIVGVHRGMNDVDELDIIQMIGRAGRYGIDDAGFVYMVIPSGSTAKWKATINNPKPVTSGLKDTEILAFHILSEIYTKNVINENDVREWFSRSLAYIQQIDINEDEVGTVIQDLLNMKMVKKQKIGDILKVTNMGMVSALMYYSPYDVYGWYRNFDQLYKKNLHSDQLMAWALADIPSHRLPYIPKNMIEKVSECKKYLLSHGIDYSYSDLSSISYVLSALHCFEGTEPTDGALKSTMRNLQYDAPRMMSALEMLDTKYSRWDLDWKEIALRTTYGVKKEMIDLVRIEGVGKARAEKLYSIGLRDAKAIANVDVSKLQPLFSIKLAKDIINNAKKLNTR
jgi:replicative superfamily II helicase